MTLKNLIIWFWSTLMIGGLTGLLFGLIAKPILGAFSWIDLLLLGLTFSSVSLLGFFAYLVFNWLMKGLIQKPNIYQWLLVLLIVLVIANLIYLNISQYSGRDLLFHLTIPALIISVAILVAWMKVKLTNSLAWIPTLFFMIGVTTIEAIPSINPKDAELPVITVFFTVFVLLICNAWQILQLHRWVKEPVQKGGQKEPRRSRND